MAKSNQTSSSITRRTDSGLVNDISNYHLKDNSWTRARNAINNSSTGDLGQIGNEPSNRFCVNAPYNIIGTIHLFQDKWVVFSTNNQRSEIGLFEKDTCRYRTIVNDNCLGFNQTNLISGASRETSTCSWRIYFSDGLNPDRVLDIGNPQTWPEGNYLGNNQYATGNPSQPFQVWPGVAWEQDCTLTNNCNTCIDTNVLDCEKIRLAKLLTPICARIEKGDNAGVLLNGSYFVTTAYLIDGQKVTDYFIPSNVQPLFEHNNVAGSLTITFSDIDSENFDEFELVVVSIINQNTVAKKFGVYSTRTSEIVIDIIEASLPSVDIGLIPLVNPSYERSDLMADMGNYLLRVGPTSRLNFNYQPRANLIETKWVLTEYPVDYYRNGGNKTGYLRDETYVFFIRWVYNTGEKTNSYVIPGRPSRGTLDTGPTTYYRPLVDGTDVNDNARWIAENTAEVILPGVNEPTDDGGFIINRGWMGYSESSEIYPDNQPEIWNAEPGLNPPYVNIPVGNNYDLCGKNIRLHKFPDQTVEPLGRLNHFGESLILDQNNPLFKRQVIRILGVEFGNIYPPVDNNGAVIPGIIGYEILRGDRNANRTIIAKGVVNNMGQYAIDQNKIGYYANYPYNDINKDKFLSINKPTFNCPLFGTPSDNELQNPVPFSQRHLTFHSPETMFNNPFLSAKELKVYGELHGNVDGRFEKVKDHPKLKLISNRTFFLSLITGLGIASLKASGGRRVSTPQNHITGLAFAVPPTTEVLMAPARAAMLGTNTALNILNNVFLTTGQYLLDMVAPGTSAVITAATNTGITALANTPGVGYSSPIIQTEDGETSRLGLFAALAPTMLYYWSIGTDSALQLIRSFLRFREFALQYDSHCEYNSFVNFTGATKLYRNSIADGTYLDNNITNFDNGLINNLYRSRTVALKIDATPNPQQLNPPPTTEPQLPYPNSGSERTRILASEVPSLYDINFVFGSRLVNPDKESFNSNSYVYYTALKQRLQNQYGQLDRVRQIPVSSCTRIINQPITNQPVLNSGPLFNGDTYIGRYTEKNTFFYFFDWLNKQPDGFEYDYSTRRMLKLYPRFWLNSEKFETSDFIQSLSPANLITGGGITTPKNYYNLDGQFCSGIFSLSPGKFNLAVKYAWFYLFNSGIRDFYVESEINIDLRDWEDRPERRHYDPKRYTDVKALFDVDIIKSGNFMKYDYSLSHIKMYSNFISWSLLQPRNYDPQVAEFCYTYRPNRILYSLPQQLELTRDNWKVFLVNNYKDFRSRPTAIKKTDMNGAMFFFENESPVKYQGVDQLQTDLGVKITLGDGGLFSQPQQNIDNSERSIEYASCQSRLGVINTPFGIYWMSQDQGKIFTIGKGLKELSMKDIKWWLSTYLPSQLLKQFPDFELRDNPVLGIGCQITYDNDNNLIYFCKKDYSLKSSVEPRDVIYVGDNRFIINNLRFSLGDPDNRWKFYFDDASWTLSYDPKMDKWMSYHDWHPDLSISTKNTFLTIKNRNNQGGIWVHNDRCDDYCNYYGIYYPFEVELNFNSVQQVTTLRSIQYQLECYKYSENCFDRFHNLDYNFNQMVVYNSEQCSGILRLNIKPKNDLQELLRYPILNSVTGIIDVLFSKEENNYRVNQFWDITLDRGEFPNISIPGNFAERAIWQTSPDGYQRQLNPANISVGNPNFGKNALQRKKFRHYSNNVVLTRLAPPPGGTNPYKMMLIFNNSKNLISPR